MKSKSVINKKMYEETKKIKILATYLPNETIPEIYKNEMIVEDLELKSKEELYSLGGYSLSDGEVYKDGKIEIIEKPSKYHKWNGTEWLLDIEEVRQEKRNELKNIRNKKQNEDFEFMGKVFQATEKDMRNIETKFMSFQMALMLAKTQVDKDLILNQKEEWTLKDNTKFEMTARDILALYMAWDDRNKKIHYHCNTTLYDLLDKATTVEEIEAIKWE